ncbi:SprT family zinc-dependent metalloprotease [Gilvimarinus sp. SDUM040013]|uniref:SprT family zinc-dependent metalloprotease n=1 Tax=Gilvimarinus gilvus TaxID=3058038 RepID=A0ABU4RY73_9GAMM|nr:SprT family zinc-dependent metalloprotease [Gilvimarinus sp. SDUM040013]MDO3387375.1 SprT family zinc-dependent metalloprotease [Gilvimarinus sp. SDUM040013]MDX6849852.1 SprT family zinc-dependent metalloprotease [Gilvimarinus sp. SDUM040013]
MADSFPWPLEYRFSQRRKSVGLEVREGRVIVRAPAGYPSVLLARIVRNKVRWISAKVAEQSVRMAARPRYNYQDGDLLPYLGSHLRLRVGAGRKQSVTREADTLSVCTSARSNKTTRRQTYEEVSLWYRQQGLALLTEKTHNLCARQGLECRSVKVRLTRSKWGHCTRTGDIQYSWQILLAPEPVVDYLVAHEVSHLRYPHHGASFWRYVEQLYPGFEPQRQWLRDHGHTLILPAPE